MATKEPITNQIATKLKNKTQMTNQEIRNAVKNTIKEYEPLITDKKPALILYAKKEHNIQLLNKENTQLKIKNIVNEMNDVQLKAKVQKVDKFTYYKENEKRQGCDITLKDQTGTISLMLWGDQVGQISTKLEKEKVKISGANSSRYKGELQLGFYEKVKIKKINAD